MKIISEETSLKMGRGGEIQTDRETDRERQTKRERQRQRDKDRERKTETERDRARSQLKLMSERTAVCRCRPLRWTSARSVSHYFIVSAWRQVFTCSTMDCLLYVLSRTSSSQLGGRLSPAVLIFKLDVGQICPPGTAVGYCGCRN